MTCVIMAQGKTEGTAGANAKAACCYFAFVGVITSSDWPTLCCRYMNEMFCDVVCYMLAECGYRFSFFTTNEWLI